MGEIPGLRLGSTRVSWTTLLGQKVRKCQENKPKAQKEAQLEDLPWVKTETKETPVMIIIETNISESKCTVITHE